MAVNTAIRKTANRSVEDLKPHPISEKIYGEEELSESFIDSIKQHGVLETIIVKPDGTIISGHRRWRAAKEVGLKTVAVKTVAFKDDIEEKEAIISYNFQREKTFSQKMAEAEVLHVIQKAKAEKRRLSTLKRGEHFPEVEHAPPRELGKTRDKVAVAIGIGSGRHYDKAKTIWDKAKTGDKEALKMVKKLDGKEITIGKAYRDIKSKPQLTGRIGKTECPLKSIETPSELPAENSVIKLGDHILIVGDNTEDSIIKTIKEHGPYDLSFADPPYGAGVEDWDRSFTWEQDYLSDIADIVCVTPGTISIQRFMKETKMPYVWSLATYITNSMTNGKLGFSNWFYTAIFSRKKSIYQGTGEGGIISRLLQSYRIQEST